MAKSDIAMKQYLRNKQRFADLYNVNCFNGNQIITPDSLREIRGETDIIIRDNELPYLEINAKAVQRRRDIIMEWNNSVILMLLACELQSTVSHAMPARCMLYDAMAYTDQMSATWSSLSPEEKRLMNGNEFFSRFRECDKLYPVITLVVYYGEDEWNGSLELYDMFKINKPDIINTIKPFVANYKVNFIDLNHAANLQAYKSDLGVIFGMAKFRRDKDGLKEYVNVHSDYFQSADLETVNAVQAIIKGHRRLTKSIFENKIEGGRYDMCKALEDMCNDARNGGIEIGRADGIEIGRADGIKKAIRILQKVGFNDNSIADMISTEYNIGHEEVLPYMHET